MQLFAINSKDQLGPYNSYEELCKVAFTAAQVHAAVSSDETDIEYSLQMASLLSRYETQLSEWNESQPTFTHVDPGLQNIIIRQIPNSATEDWKVTFIDFAYSG